MESQRSIAVLLLFLLSMFDKRDKFKERGAVVKAFKDYIITCITYIDKIYGHIEVSSGNYITDQRIEI